MVDVYIFHPIDQGNKDFCAFTHVVHLPVGCIDFLRMYPFRAFTRGCDKSGPYRIRYM
jgi:hypothetical protein